MKTVWGLHWTTILQNQINYIWTKLAYEYHEVKLRLYARFRRVRKKANTFLNSIPSDSILIKMFNFYFFPQSFYYWSDFLILIFNLYVELFLSAILKYDWDYIWRWDVNIVSPWNLLRFMPEMILKRHI